MVLRDWHRDINNTVKWNGTLSHKFPIHQGTPQGSVISPHAYKMNDNDALGDIQAQHIGAIIKTMCCAAPTCADDVALIASTESGEMCTLLNTIEIHPNMDRLTINSSKSVVLQYPVGRKTLWPHISGFSKEPLAPQQIGTRTIMATRTMYALFGAGLYGRNGFNPMVSAKIWTTYIHGCYTVQSSGASTTQTQTFWRSSSGID